MPGKSLKTGKPNWNMAKKKKTKKIKKRVVEVGEVVPRSLKFGIIVAIALFWAQFLREILIEFLDCYFEISSVSLVDFILAVMATILGIAILETYRKITSKLRKVKV